MFESMNDYRPTTADLGEFQKQAKTLREKDGFVKYKNFLLLNYLYAIQTGDIKLRRYTNRNLVKAYSQLGTDEYGRCKDVHIGMQWLKKLLLEHSMEQDGTP